MSSARMVSAVLYTKPDCPLCDYLKADLAWLGEQLPLSVQEHDITQDAVLFDQFRYLIPVLEVDGVFHYPPHDLVRLHQVVDAAGRAVAG
jgi:glutaredoxin